MNWMLFLTLTFCAATSAQSAIVVETRPNGDRIVTIDGKEYRALSADNYRQVIKDRADLEALRKEVPLQKEQVLIEKGRGDGLETVVKEQAAALAKADIALQSKPGLFRRILRLMF